MQVARLILSFALIFGPSPRLNSQQPVETPQRDPRALSVLGQSLFAMGSTGQAIQDSVADGTITFSDGRSGKITLKSKGTDRIRNEVGLSSDESVMVVVAGKGHAVQANQTRPLPIWMTSYLRPNHIPVLSRISDSAKPNTKVLYIGLEDVKGQLAHHIRLSNLPASGKGADIEEIISEFHVFVDAQTHLVVKTLSYDFSPVIVENRTPVETYFSDYHLVSGVQVPFRITRYIRGSKDSEIFLSNVQFNVGLPDTHFQ